MTDSEHRIWSNYDLRYEDWASDLESEYPDLSEDERYLKMLEINADYLDDERANLNIQLSQPILVIADLGLWNGRRPGYREIQSGNIRDCLYGGHDYITWYVDSKGDLRCEDIHHDGTNHYLYRAYKSGTTEAQRNQLKSKIYDGSVTEQDIARFTRRLGDDIGRVYGWTFQKEKTTKERAR